MGKIQVTRESETGLNERFKVGNRELSRRELVSEIKNGLHPDYHVMNQGGRQIPRSNPDNSSRNNLG